MKILKTFFFSAFTFLISAESVSAHVRYLVDDSKVRQNSGVDNDFLLSALLDPYNIFLMSLSVIALAVALVIYVKFNPFHYLIARVCKRASGYNVFVPWMLRISAGIALIGSGVSNYMISPVVTGFHFISTLEILIGFFLMAGFLVLPSALVAIFLYISAFQADWYVLGNLDFFVIVLSLLIVDNERPGIDDLIGMPHFSPLHKLKHFVPFILRLGIGGAMIFLAVYEKFLNPHISEIIVTDFGLLHVFPASPEMWVLGAGITEFILGAALIVGYRVRLVSAITFIVLSLSFFYFDEDVASHITLFGTLAVIFILGGGKWSLDKTCEVEPAKIKRKNRKRSPIGGRKKGGEK